ncbi:hypothetical protein DICA1_A05204 [Diutina catenulata]
MCAAHQSVPPSRSGRTGPPMTTLGEPGETTRTPSNPHGDKKHPFSGLREAHEQPDPKPREVLRGITCTMPFVNDGSPDEFALLVDSATDYWDIWNFVPPFSVQRRQELTAESIEHFVTEERLRDDVKQLVFEPGSLFDSKEVETLLEANGVAKKHTVFDSRSVNAMRSVLAQVRASKEQSNFPDSKWFWAAIHAVDRHNHTTDPHTNQSPAQRLHGQQPLGGHSQPFGCLVKCSFNGLVTFYGTFYGVDAENNIYYVMMNNEGKMASVDPAKVTFYPTKFPGREDFVPPAEHGASKGPPTQEKRVIDWDKLVDPRVPPKQPTEPFEEFSLTMISVPQVEGGKPLLGFGRDPVSNYWYIWDPTDPRTASMTLKNDTAVEMVVFYGRLCEGGHNPIQRMVMAPGSVFDSPALRGFCQKKEMAVEKRVFDQGAIDGVNQLLSELVRIKLESNFPDKLWYQVVRFIAICHNYARDVVSGRSPAEVATGIENCELLNPYHSIGSLVWYKQPRGKGEWVRACGAYMGISGNNTRYLVYVWELDGLIEADILEFTSFFPWALGPFTYEGRHIDWSHLVQNEIDWEAMLSRP